MLSSHPPIVSVALSLLAALAVSASTLLAASPRSHDASVGELASAQGAPARQAAPPPVRSAGPASGANNAPPSADDADATTPEGLKVRDPGRQPEFKGGPALYFHALDHDFGAMTNAQTKSHRFTFVNAGDAPLTIQAVVPKCACTRPAFESGKVYQPGESGFIDVAFTPPTGGHQAKALMVQSNAAWPSEVFNIRVIAKVESVLSFEPKSLDIGEIRRGAGSEAEFKVVADAKATTFDSVSSRSREVTGSFVGAGPHRGEVTIKVVVDPTVPWGSLRGGALMLTTSGVDEGGAKLTKSLPLRITGVVVDEIRASAYLFQMKTVRPGSPFIDSVFLYHEAGKPIEVTDVVLAAMGVESRGIAAVTYRPIQVTQETRDGKPGVLITLSGDTPRDAQGFIGGSVRFKARTVGDPAFVQRELSIGGRVMTEAAERNLPANRGAR